jgi:hypothetical protein
LKTPVEENPSDQIPTDPYLQARAENELAPLSRLLLMNRPGLHPPGIHEHAEDKLKKFLDNDRKVLRYYCAWDDRESLYGELREYVCAFTGTMAHELDCPLLSCR